MTLSSRLAFLSDHCAFIPGCHPTSSSPFLLCICPFYPVFLLSLFSSFNKDAISPCGRYSIPTYEGLEESIWLQDVLQDWCWGCICIRSTSFSLSLFMWGHFRWGVYGEVLKRGFKIPQTIPWCCYHYVCVLYAVPCWVQGMQRNPDP